MKLGMSSVAARRTAFRDPYFVLLFDEHPEFAKLEQYFEDEPLDSVLQVAKEDFVQVASPEHRFSMVKFWDILHTSSKQPVSQAIPPESAAADVSHCERPQLHGSLEPWIDLSNKVCGSVSLQFPDEKAIVHVTAMADYVARCAAQIDGGEFSLDLSRNDLMAKDVALICKALGHFSCKTVDLSNNRLFATPQDQADFFQQMNGLLSRGGLSFCDITINLLASIDFKEYFVSCLHLDKLIFVPEHWLEAGHWKAMFDDDERKCQIVEVAHRRYYTYRAQRRKLLPHL